MEPLPLTKWSIPENKSERWLTIEIGEITKSNTSSQYSTNGSHEFLNYSNINEGLWKIA